MYVYYHCLSQCILGNILTPEQVKRAVTWVWENSATYYTGWQCGPHKLREGCWMPYTHVKHLSWPNHWSNQKVWFNTQKSQWHLTSSFSSRYFEIFACSAATFFFFVLIICAIFQCQFCWIFWYINANSDASSEMAYGGFTSHLMENE